MALTFSRVSLSGLRWHTALFTAAFAALSSSSASAQHLPRMRVDLEGAVGSIVSNLNGAPYGVGPSGSLRVRVRLLGPFGVHLTGAANGWSFEGTNATLWSAVYMGGGGLHVMPKIGPGTLLVDTDVMGGTTDVPFVLDNGSNTAVYLSAGVGYLVRATSFLDVGPVARVLWGRQSESSTATDRNALTAFTAGVTLSFHPSPPPPPPVAIVPKPSEQNTPSFIVLTICSNLTFLILPRRLWHSAS